MQRDVLGAASLGQPGGLDSVDCVIVKAGANLNGHWNRDGLFDLLENRFQPRMILEQTRSAAVLHHFRRGTAAVHVQDVGPDFLGHLGGHAHPLRLAAEDLHGERAFVFIEAHLAF